jgi:hypothetical protein
MNTEIASRAELALVMKAMAFKYANREPDYYERIFRRADVMAHRAEHLPIYLNVLSDPRYLVAWADASFSNQNDIEKQGWCDLTIRGSHLVHANTGKGPRLPIWSVVSTIGVLSHPDGGSSGSVLNINEIMDRNVIYRLVERSLEALLFWANRLSKVPILIIDGAPNQKTFNDDAIVPHRVL